MLLLHLYRLIGVSTPSLPLRVYDIYLCDIYAIHHVYVSCTSLPSDLAVLTLLPNSQTIRAQWRPDSFKVPFNAGLVGATMGVIESTRRLGHLTEMDENSFGISAHKKCWSLPNSSNKLMRSPYVGSAPVGYNNIHLALLHNEHLPSKSDDLVAMIPSMHLHNWQTTNS